MNLQYFPHFIRACYPEAANEPNDDLMQIGADFKLYLQEKFRDSPEKLELIWDITFFSVMKNQIYQKPSTVNGYHPALLIHFSNFVQHMIKEQEK